MGFLVPVEVHLLVMAVYSGEPWHGQMQFGGVAGSDLVCYTVFKLGQHLGQSYIASCHLTHRGHPSRTCLVALELVGCHSSGHLSESNLEELDCPSSWRLNYITFVEVE